MMSERSRGVLFALVAYGVWGVAPIYFKWLTFAGPDEIIVHRIVWSFVLLVAVVVVRKSWKTLGAILRSQRQLGLLFVSGVLVATNWLVFIWALQNDRMIETSLGYYIVPLVNILLGVVFLGERLRGLQLVALALACAGVVNEIVGIGGLPWVSLSLAISFGLYGLVRKVVAVDSALGLTVETALLTPFAVGYFVWLWLAGDAVFPQAGAAGNAALIGMGIITTIPLVAFAAAAVRLPLSVLGFLQYSSPTIVLLLAVFVYHEPFQPSQATTFACIFGALAVFTISELRRLRRVA